MRCHLQAPGRAVARRSPGAAMRCLPSARKRTTRRQTAELRAPTTAHALTHASGQRPARAPPAGPGPPPLHRKRARAWTMSLSSCKFFRDLKGRLFFGVLHSHLARACSEGKRWLNHTGCRKSLTTTRCCATVGDIESWTPNPRPAPGTAATPLRHTPGNRAP